MKNSIKILFLFILITAFANTKQSNVERIVSEFKKAESSNVLVAAHRGDWRHTPENSLEGIKNCIAMGIDMVEVDVHKTKDGQLILMHDKTINRTTNGRGEISDYTLVELKHFFLKENRGGKKAKLTEIRIPTLEEALLTAKGEIMLNLDKAYGLMDEIYPILVKTGTVGQILMKGSSKPKQVAGDLSAIDSTMFYMPIVSDKEDSAVSIIKEHLNLYKPAAFELILKKGESLMEQSAYIKKHGARVWVNTLWASLCDGHEDAKALKNPDENWGWVISKGANIIQTDNPKELLEYLKKKGLRDF